MPLSADNVDEVEDILDERPALIPEPQAPVAGEDDVTDEGPTEVFGEEEGDLAGKEEESYAAIENEFDSAR